ncbi:MAG: MEDS domain-containing protein [Gemmatimonadales bacterium]|nr:MEDS domain-containing protein [Gemmatimonadales bacterium]
MSSCAYLLQSPRPYEHFAQLYGQDERALIANMAQYVREGLNEGHAVLAVITGKHREALLRRLKRSTIGAREAIDEGRLVILEASSVLAQVVVEGTADWARFDAIIGSAVRALLATPGVTGLRAFGELVGLLWSAGQRTAAAKLEEHWTRLLELHGFTLFCAYPIDVDGAEFPDADIDTVLMAHTHVLPANRDGDKQPAPLGQVRSGDAARLLGTTTRTLLFYEEEGLVRPKRTAGGSRTYSPFDLARSEVAIRLSRLGFPLKLIKALTSARPDAASGAEASRTLQELFDEMRRDIAGRIDALHAIAADLEQADGLVRQCATCPNPPTRQRCPACPCELGLDRSALLYLTSDPGG